MLSNIESYSLPSEIFAKLVELAESTDSLFIDELHGTQEIPRIVANWLSLLYERGYRGIGVEVPRFAPENLIRASNAIVVNWTERKKPVFSEK